MHSVLELSYLKESKHSGLELWSKGVWIFVRIFILKIKVKEKFKDPKKIKIHKILSELKLGTRIWMQIRNRFLLWGRNWVEEDSVKLTKMILSEEECCWNQNLNADQKVCLLWGRIKGEEDLVKLSNWGIKEESQGRISIQVRI